MKPVTLRTRAEIPLEYRWNAESVFATPADWDVELQRLDQELPGLESFKGCLGESPQTLLAGFRAFEALSARVFKVYVYANLSHEVDTGDQAAGAMLGKAIGLYGKVECHLRFHRPRVALHWPANPGRLAGAGLRPGALYPIY